MLIKVKDGQTGFCNRTCERLKAGDELELKAYKKVIRDERGKPKKDVDGNDLIEVVTPEKQFSSTWMEVVEERQKPVSAKVIKGRGSRTVAQPSMDEE